LEELDQRLDKIAKKLGITKRDVLSVSQIDLDVAIKEKDISSDLTSEDSKEDKKDKITLGQDDKKQDQGLEEERQEQNKHTLDNIKSKQEIDLNKKIDDRYTLADVLGTASNAKLIVVNSNNIVDNKNTTRFSFIIEEADGTLREADMLNQVGGKDSNKNVYETNRDGSKVQNQTVKSSFGIDSQLVKNGILTVRIGQMGVVEVGYGEMDKTSHKDAFTQRLETDELYPTTARVREEFSRNKGEYKITEKIDEIKEHEEHGCDMTIDDADGDPYTGHDHSENAVKLILEDKDVGKKINDVFTESEIKERFELMKEKHPDKDFDELVEITKMELETDADYMHSIERKH
ncbi:MAG: hypothetical protein K2H53_06225, partial [Clostridia bacterium]|nr:hypothetical protein [Clostridia bacterium]